MIAYVLIYYIKNFFIIIFILLLIFKKYFIWGLGIGDWGLGIGPNPQSPIPTNGILFI